MSRAVLGGRSAEADLGQVLRNRLTVVGTVLRARSPGEKLELTREFRKRVLPLIREGRLRPVVDRIAQKQHRVPVVFGREDCFERCSVRMDIGEEQVRRRCHRSAARVPGGERDHGCCSIEGAV